MRFFSLIASLLLATFTVAAERNIVRTAKSGPWEAADTWIGGKVPAAGESVLIRPGHRVTYASKNEKPFRAIHIGGTLSFDPDKDTLLAVGLLKIQPGEDTAEEGFDCEAHIEMPKDGVAKPALEVGKPDTPIRKSATIRLHYFEGMNKESLPAIVCCGGRMDFHGSPMSRTWVKLGADAKKGDTEVDVARSRERVEGRRQGDSDGHAGPRRAPRGFVHGGSDNQGHRRRQAHARQAARKRARRQRRLSRRSGQPVAATSIVESADPDEARPHDVSPPFGRLDQLRRVSPPGQGRRARPLCHSLSPRRRHDARQLRRRRVDLGQRQSLAHDPRHELPRRPRLRRLPERRPRLLPRRRHRGLQRPRPQPGRAGQARQAAAEAGVAVRRQRRGRLLVGQSPQHVHAQRRLRE